MMSISKTKTCATCPAHFSTVLDGPLYEFCAACRFDLGIMTAYDAQQMLTLFDQTAPGKRGDLLEAEKMRRKRGGGPREIAPVKPVINLAAVKAGIRAQTAYGILADDRDASAPAPPTEYVIAQNGLFEVIHTDIADIIRVPKKVLGVDTALKEGIVSKLPPIPFEFLRQTLAFFKAVCAKHANSEAFVRIWWNRKESRYEMQVPKQRVSGGGVHHEDTFDRENGGDWLIAADIHSHNTMSAFWSGIDDADERKAPDGRIHGVIGKVPSKWPEWKWRMKVKEGFIDLNASDVFQMAAEDVPFTVSWATILRCLGMADSLDSEGRLKLVCPVEPFADLTFPQEWLENVEGYHSRGSWTRSAATGGSAAGRFRGTQYLYILNQKTGVAEEKEVIDGVVGRLTGKSIVVLKREGEDEAITH